MSNKPLNAKDIDAILPQTQCGLCDYDGCLPYAEAIVTGDADIDHCHPGGIPTLHKIAELTHQDASAFEKKVEAQYRPPAVVVIREDECIGCTKCIQACPVDAIVGAAKLMHTVITKDCNGCELCIPPCPVDCIDIIALKEKTEAEEAFDRERNRVRYHARNERLKRLEHEAQEKHSSAKANRMNMIQEALARAKK